MKMTKSEAITFKWPWGGSRCLFSVRESCILKIAREAIAEKDDTVPSQIHL